jgi:GntR family transcriptional regulator
MANKAAITMTNETATSRITSDLRKQIQDGELGPGALLPSEPELGRQYAVSRQTARTALQTLEQEGLITVRARRGRIVRIPPRRAVRSSERHQEEKDRAILSERERKQMGEAETNFGMSIADQQFTAFYDIINANEELAKGLNVDLSTPLLRRKWISAEPKTDRLLSTSVSYIPKSLVESNPALLDANNEPWPGGTMHQLSTVGIEIMRIVDEVTARMPTSAEAQAWDMSPGIPLLICRRISFDTDGRTIEISDAEYPADRTELRFVTSLTPWPTPPERTR